MPEIHAQKSDTLNIYKKIKKSTDKHKFTALLYDAIFVDPVAQVYEKKPLSDAQKKVDPNAKFTGKIIRKIIISVKDPFGYSVNDTFTRNINSLQKLGNKIHITTHSRIIRNILLFEPDDSVEHIRITESERLLRAMNYINDARIFIKATETKDSVDIVVKVLDKWSLVISGSADINGGNFRIRDKNIAGLGQTYEQYLSYNKTTGHDIRGNYHISNIKNTFISSDVRYSTTKMQTTTGIAFNRYFFSPLTKWAGGIEGNRTWGNYPYRDSIDKSATLNYFNYDLWMAKSFPLNLNNKNERNSNIVIGARYNTTRYLVRPSFLIDTGKTNTKQDLYLVNFGYSLRKYYKDMFIYRFGANEDIPEGLLISGTYGIAQREIKGKASYAGMEISNGKHFNKFGYLSAYFSMGTYYNTQLKNNTTFDAGAAYFSDLYKNRKWYFRHFIYYKIIQGLHKESYENVTIYSSEMYGFNSNSLPGSGKMILNLQTIVYAPYNIIGFKFAPVASMAFGMLDTKNSTYGSGQVYQAYSLGLLIRNENLLNSSFAFSVGYYPLIPGGERNVFKLNPIVSFSLNLRKFEISKPATVTFN